MKKMLSENYKKQNSKKYIANYLEDKGPPKHTKKKNRRQFHRIEAQLKLYSNCGLKYL